MTKVKIFQHCCYTLDKNDSSYKAKMTVLSLKKHDGVTLHSFVPWTLIVSEISHSIPVAHQGKGLTFLT